MGVCMGKFTKAKHFRLKITSLDVLAQHAKVRAPPSSALRSRSAAAPALHLVQGRQRPPQGE